MNGVGTKVALLCLVWGMLGLLAACGEPPEAQTQVRKRVKKNLTGFGLLRKDDCLTCHSIEDDKVGPPYESIAARYDSEPETVERLALKIMEGGGGLWGKGLMNKHPFMKKPEARKIIRWVLSLDDSTKNVPPSQTSNLNSWLDQSSPEGFKVEVYSESVLGPISSRKFPVVGVDVKPEYQFLIPYIHLQSNPDFRPLRGLNLIKVEGTVSIAQKGMYLFKMSKQGRGYLRLNGDILISDRPEDHEAEIQLAPGTYPLSMHYLMTGQEDQLSLQWIPLDKDYYELLRPKSMSTK